MKRKLRVLIKAAQALQNPSLSTAIRTAARLLERRATKLLNGFRLYT